MRQGLLTVAKTSKYKIGGKILLNRLSIVNYIIVEKELFGDSFHPSIVIITACGKIQHRLA
jgi:hypothetical protein